MTALQRLCEHISALSKPVIVQEFLGRWFQVGNNTAAGILAVHAALLHTGKIVYFGGDQHTGSLNTSGDVDHTRLFDCATHAITTVTGLPGTSDLFCSGHALLADGRILAAGGTRKWGGGGIHPPGHFIGLRDAWLFDPADDQWHATGKLVTQRPEEVADGVDIEKTGGKWYPTLVTLPDGRVLALSGHPEIEDSRHNNNSLELYDPASGTWSIVGPNDYGNIDSVDARQYEYPRLHVLPDGTVISMSRMSNGRLERWHPYADANDWDDVIDPPPEAIYTNNFAQDTHVGPVAAVAGRQVSRPRHADRRQHAVHSRHGQCRRRLGRGDALDVRSSGHGRREPDPRERRLRSSCRPARSSSKAGSRTDPTIPPACAHRRPSIPRPAPGGSCRQRRSSAAITARRC